MAIPNAQVVNHHIGDVLEDIPMSMKAEDFSHLAFMFENMYPNPIAAVVREYATNAWDSHVFAGNPNPIEVTLPTEDSLLFVVKDYGLGMSIDTVRETFAFYGASSKRETNAVAGQLGIGSKSALAYAPGFTVTAVQAGVSCTIYSTKDEHGLGMLKVMDTRATDEPDGVTVQVPVERHDVHRFIQAAERLFQFWEEGTVLIDGEPPAVPNWRTTALPLDQWDHTLLVRNNVGLDSSYVVMGNVPYPVSDANVGRETVRFVAVLNISDVDFAPSREDVRHTPHTDATLAELNDYIKVSYKRAIAAHLATAQTAWEETMLKVLWMDRGMSVRGNIWTYDPDAWRRKARKHSRYNVSYLTGADVHVITGFKAQNLSTVARERMVEHIGGVTRNVSFVVLPTGCAGVAAIDGHPRLYNWDDICGAAKPAPGAPKVKRPKVETRYSVMNAGSMTADELAEVKGKVLYLMPDSHYSHGDLGCTVVVLRSSNQLPRVKRYVPRIKPYHEEVARLRKRAEKAITDQDRAIVRARTLPDAFVGLDPDDVLDSEIADALRLCELPDTPTMIEATRFGISIEAKSMEKALVKRYPLIDDGSYWHHTISVTDENRADFLLYINAKFDQITDPALDVKAS